MAGLLIPNDHNLSTDPYTFLVAEVPDSALWRATVVGQLLGLASDWRWDADTGDPDTAAEAGWQIFDSAAYGEIDGGGA